LVLAGLTVEVIKTVLIGEEYMLFKPSYADQLRFGSNPMKSAAKVLVTLVGILSGFLIFYDTGNYLSLTRDRIVLQRYDSVKQNVYPVSDVLSILTANKTMSTTGKTIYRTAYSVSLKGNQRFNSLALPGTASDKYKIFQLISQYSGVPLTAKEILTTNDLE
jgi:hypothetical protein